MNASIRSTLRAAVFVAALVASVATSLATAWELDEESNVLPVQLAAGEVLEFDLVLRGNEPAFHQANLTEAYGDASVEAELTGDGDGPAVVLLAVELLPLPVESTLTLAPGESATLYAGGNWEPAQKCTFVEANSEAGCTVRYRVTLTADGGGASGTLQGFVRLSGPEGSPDEHAPGELEVTLVPVAR